MTEHTCPVCGYDGDVEFRPKDNQICGCCGTEFGYDTRIRSIAELRREWINNGFPWFDPDEPKPAQWNGGTQLVAAGLVPQETAFGLTETVFGDEIYPAGDFIMIRLAGDAPSLRLNWAPNA